ncbi:MAG: hypothetical protein IJI57_13610 [Flexilinea sp.]|nr:hypothetical protein [Flexilinea sp.]
MRIRIINEKDWERSFELDKSIIRVGSQVTSDVYVNDPEVPALLMQITRTGNIDTRYTMRFFADNLTLTRGEQSFPPDINMPYEVLDGDKVGFNRYRMIIELESDRSRVRQSEHMRAEMFLSSRDLSPDKPISGGMLLKNLGTQRPCQFRLNIRGIPQDCLYSSPMPYLHPGASSSVGFTISHLKTKPGPGFHTVSITLSAPDDYYGEMLEFNQDIYVYPVFDNLMILEDDTDKLSGANKNGEDVKGDTLPEPVTVLPDMSVRDSGMMNLDESVFASNSAPQTPVRVLGKDSKAQAPSFDETEDDEELPGYRRKKERVVVIRSDDDKLFEGENADDLRQLEDPDAAATEADETADAVTETGPAESAADTEAETAAAVEQRPAVQETKMPEPEPVTLPEEPRPAPSRKKKAVKFKPEEVKVFSAKNDAFDDEDQEPVAGGHEPVVGDHEPVVGGQGSVAGGQLPDEPKAEEIAVEEAVTKGRKKRPAKEPETVQTEAEAAPEQEKNILALEAAPAEDVKPKQEKKGRKKKDESVVGGQGSVAGGQLSEETLPEDNASIEEPVMEEVTPEEQPSPKETVSVDETAPQEETPAEQSLSDDAAAVEEAVSEEIIPEEQPSPKEPVSVDETAPEEETPAEQSLSDDAVAVEEAVSEEVTPAEQPSPNEATPDEETIPENVIPAEQDVIPAEEEQPEVITPVVEKVPELKPQVPIFSHSAGFDEFSEDEDSEPEEKGDDTGKPAFLVMKGDSFD